MMFQVPSYLPLYHRLTACFRTPLWLAALVCLCWSPASHAGGACPNSNMTGHSNGWLPTTYGADRRFHNGKRTFFGRKVKEKIEFCILHEGKLAKVDHRRMREFRGDSVTALAFSLVDCNAPHRLALARIDKQSVPDVLYYLNSKYRLALTAPDASLIPGRTMVASNEASAETAPAPAGD
ncbi:MAG: hypothetical protein AAF513_08185 [Pseudomonadota bacterium]